jgi:hypothetical protein
MEQHKRSKNHKKSEKIYLEANPEVAQSSMFQNLTSDKPLITSALQLLGAGHSSHTSQSDQGEEVEGRTNPPEDN